MDGNNPFDEVSGRNEEQLIGNWRKGISYYKVAKTLAELCFFCSSVLWKVGLGIREMGYSLEKTSIQRAEGVAWFLLTTYGKFQKGRNELRKNC